jgi:hypothetical protein
LREAAASTITVPDGLPLLAELLGPEDPQATVTMAITARLSARSQRAAIPR